MSRLLTTHKQTGTHKPGTEVRASIPTTWKAEAEGGQVHNFLKSLVMPVAGKERTLSRGTRTIEGWGSGKTGGQNGFCQF